MNVMSPAPVDVGGIVDEACQAAVLLGCSLGWTTVRKLNKPIRLIAVDGTALAIPTNTSVQFNVWRHWINSIYTHRADDTEATTELIEAISKRIKLSPAHRKVMYDGVARLMRATPEPTETAEEQSSEESLETSGTPHTMIERKPLIARGGFAGKGESLQVAWESDFVDTLLWSNGHMEYACRWCERRFTTAQLAGMHGNRAHPEHKTPAPDDGHYPDVAARMRAAGKTFLIDRKTGVYVEDLPPIVRKSPKPEATGIGELGIEGVFAIAEAVASTKLDRGEMQTHAILPDEHGGIAGIGHTLDVVQDTIVEHEPKVFVETATAEQKLEMIANIVGFNPELEHENITLRARVAELESNLQALREIIGGIR